MVLSIPTAPIPVAFSSGATLLDRLFGAFIQTAGPVSEPLASVSLTPTVRYSCGQPAQVNSEHGAQGMRQWTNGALVRTLMAKKLAYEDRKIAFEKQVKLAIAKEFSAGNKALPLDSGFPPSYGFLSEEDMAEILRKAAAGIDGTTDCVGDYLFHREPYLD